MRMIKVGDKYLALVDDQKSAMRFTSDAAQTRTIAGSISEGAGLTATRVVARVVKITSRIPSTDTIAPMIQSDADSID